MSEASDTDRQVAAELAGRCSTVPAGGPEEWPTPLDGMGKTWAVRTIPGTLSAPLVIVKIWPPTGTDMSAMATMYDVAGFRALLAKMQEIADTLPPEGT